MALDCAGARTEKRRVEDFEAGELSPELEGSCSAGRGAGPLGDDPVLGEWHTAPQRQYVMFLKGETEIEVSDGEKRHFKTGDVFLVEDTTGKGHRNLRLHKDPELWAFARSLAED